MNGISSKTFLQHIFNIWRILENNFNAGRLRKVNRHKLLITRQKRMMLSKNMIIFVLIDKNITSVPTLLNKHINIFMSLFKCKNIKLY